MLRRDIGILGLLQKRVLGKAHPVFQELLPFHRDIYDYIRKGVAEHDKAVKGKKKVKDEDQGGKGKRQSGKKNKRSKGN